MGDKKIDIEIKNKIFLSALLNLILKHLKNRKINIILILRCRNLITSISIRSRKKLKILNIQVSVYDCNYHGLKMFYKILEKSLIAGKLVPYQSA